MIRLCEVTISSHFALERAERCRRINEVLGGDWGEIICSVEDPVRHTVLAVTDTGLYAVLDKSEKFLITCYLARFHRAKTLFDLAGLPMPKDLRRRINQNGRRYFGLYAEAM